MIPWYKTLNKSKLTPPPYIFGIVWPILYLSMFVSTYMLWNHKKCFPYCSPLTFFFIQLALNLIWTTLFFKLKKPIIALVDLFFIILFTAITIRQYYTIYSPSAFFLVPYFMWISFAFYLNTYIVLNN